VLETELAWSCYKYDLKSGLFDELRHEIRIVRKNKEDGPQSSSKRMLTPGDEDAILKDIKEGVEIAMHRRNHPVSDIGPIKINKLAYLAIRRFGLDEITFGWYKFGPAPVDVSGSSDPQGTSVEISPRAREEIRAAESSRIPTPSNRYPSPEEFAHFFLDDLEEFDQIINTPTKQYLVEFYEEHAPASYRDLYIKSAKLQQTLDEIGDDERWHETAEQHYDDVGEELNEVLAELIQAPQLSESVVPFRQYSGVVKNILAAASSQENISETQQRFISQVVDFFYGSTWKYVALLMSKDTVRGDNDERLRNSTEDLLRDLRSRHDDDLDQLQDRSGLYNLSTEPITGNQDSADQEGDSAEYTQNSDEVDAWTRLASEVIVE